MPQFNYRKHLISVLFLLSGKYTCFPQQRKKLHVYIFKKYKFKKNYLLFAQTSEQSLNV